jgi:hypothetical protein
MSKKALSAAIAIAVLFAPLGESFAGGKAVECYAHYRQAPVYDMVQEREVFRGAQIREESVPAIYGTRKLRRLLAPGRVEYRVLEPEYQTVREKVLLYPERTVARTIPAVTRTQYRRVKAIGPRYAWEYRIINGKRVLCKVKRKAVYDNIAETVVVQPARVVHERVGATWGYRERSVMIAPQREQRVVYPGAYGYEVEQVLIQPAQRRVVDIPPSYQYVERQVLVREGRSGWERVAIPRHCAG